MKMKTLVGSSLATFAALGTVTAYAATNTSSTSSTTSTSSVSQHAGFHHGRPGHRGPGIGRLSDIASIIGVDASTLQSDLQSGQSLADIAQSKGVSEQTLIADIEAKQKVQLDQAVQNGTLTSSQEQKVESNMATRIQKMVEQKGVPKPPKRRHGGTGPMIFGNAAKIIGIDAATLRTDLKNGQSLADIASSKGIDESTLMSDITSAQKTQLDQAVSNGKMTAAQEQKILNNQSMHIKQLVEAKGGWHHGGKGKNPANTSSSTNDSQTQSTS